MIITLIVLVIILAIHYHCHGHHLLHHHLTNNLTSELEGDKMVLKIAKPPRDKVVRSQVQKQKNTEKYKHLQIQIQGLDRGACLAMLHLDGQFSSFRISRRAGGTLFLV